MSWSAALILCGYALMVWQFGPWGLLAALAHVGVLLLFVRRR